MTVYVDDMHTRAVGKLGRMRMSHMVADTTEQLLEMADRIGVKRKWLQEKNTPLEHFDVCMSKRKAAIEQGAVAVTWRQLSLMCYQRKLTGQLGVPPGATPPML